MIGESNNDCSLSFTVFGRNIVNNGSCFVFSFVESDTRKIEPIFVIFLYY